MIIVSYSFNKKGFIEVLVVTVKKVTILMLSLQS